MARFRRGVLMNESRVYFETSVERESRMRVASPRSLRSSLSLFLARLSPEEKKLA